MESIRRCLCIKINMQQVMQDARGWHEELKGGWGSPSTTITKENVDTVATITQEARFTI